MNKKQFDCSRQIFIDTLEGTRWGNGGKYTCPDDAGLPNISEDICKDDEGICKQCWLQALEHATFNGDKHEKVYIGGDMLYRGSQLLREQEKQDILQLGYDIYNPQDNKEINDKTNQTKESNNGLAEKIVAQDTQAIMESDILVFDCQRFAEGTLVELGQVKGMKDVAKQILEMTSADTDSLLGMLHNIQDLCQSIVDKRVYPHCEDIRRTDIEEVGDRRSFYINQYWHGVTLDLTDGKGLYTWENILKELGNTSNDNIIGKLADVYNDGTLVARGYIREDDGEEFPYVVHFIERYDTDCVRCSFCELDVEECGIVVKLVEGE